MKKLKLDVEALSVESFEPELRKTGRGTVKSHETEVETCEPYTADTCFDTCAVTCYTNHGTNCYSRNITCTTCRQLGPC